MFVSIAFSPFDNIKKRQGNGQSCSKKYSESLSQRLSNTWSLKQSTNHVVNNRSTCNDERTNTEKTLQ